MTKLTEKLYGAGLIALAFSLNAADVNAQTCTEPPSCATLGFDKSSSDCAGHSILKCPFDKTKVYCDAGTTTVIPAPDPTPTTPTYKLGDTYYHNGTPVGKVIEIKNGGTNGTISTTGTYSGTYTSASSGCANVSAGGLAWFLPTDNQIKLIGDHVSRFDGYVWSSTGKCVNYSGSTRNVGCNYKGQTECKSGTSNYYCNASENDAHKDVDTATHVQGYYCIASF